LTIQKYKTTKIDRKIGMLTAFVLPSLKTSFCPSFRYSGCFTNLNQVNTYMAKKGEVKT
jgi:hypothetical protein